MLQLVTRLGIPLGIGITTAIWSSWIPTPEKANTDSTTYPLAVTTLQLPYLQVFIATLSFAGVAVLVAPFAPLGRLGVASTATNSSLPHTDTGQLKNINLDGPGDWEEEAVPRPRGPGPSEGCSLPSWTRFKIQPRRSSLLGTYVSSDLRRTSTASFHLPRIEGFHDSEEGSGLGLGFGHADDDDNGADTKSQQTSTVAMAEKVIWLVCEDCGASKRIVEPIGDPARYFYDADEDEHFQAGNVAVDKTLTPLTPPTPSSKYSSVCDDHGACMSMAEVGARVNRRRFELVNRRGVMGSVAETSEE